MAVPTSFADLSTTPGSNSPAGSENVFPSLDDYIRFINAALASIKANTATNGWVSPYIAGTGSWAIPGTIGSTTPNTGAFTTLTATDGSGIAALSASNLGSGTVPNARFPATLPAVSGVNLTALNPANMGSGTLASGVTVPAAQLSGTSVIPMLVASSNAFGYDVGSGGTVTQATSKSTAVTLNKPTGQITMNNALLASGAVVVFQVNNSFYALADTVNLMISGGISSSINYRYWATYSGAGSFFINVENRTGAGLSEAIVFSFTITKGATS